MNNKTYIVCGNFRGGTTAVAQVLDNLGIPMGENLDPNNNYEDLEFQQLLIQETVDKDVLSHLVAKRDSMYAVWGFKFPAAHVHMPEILSFFRNPHVIFVFRDPYAVGNSEQRRAARPLYEMMERTVEYNLHMVKLLQHLKSPVHPVSFEQLLVRPGETIEKLLSFMSISLNWWDKRRLVKGVKLTKDTSSFGYANK